MTSSALVRSQAWRRPSGDPERNSAREGKAGPGQGPRATPSWDTGYTFSNKGTQAA